MLPTGCWVSSAIRPLADKNKRAKVPDRLAFSPPPLSSLPFCFLPPAQSHQGSVSEQTGSPRRHTESSCGTALLLLPFSIPQSARLAASHHTPRFSVLEIPCKGQGLTFFFLFFPARYPKKPPGSASDIVHRR